MARFINQSLTRKEYDYWRMKKHTSRIKRLRSFIPGFLYDGKLVIVYNPREETNRGQNLLIPNIQGLVDKVDTFPLNRGDEMTCQVKAASSRLMSGKSDKHSTLFRD